MSLLWVDRYRPTSLDALDYHPALTNRLRKLVRLMSLFQDLQRSFSVELD